ncbi:MAG: DUF438 domain-containing protein, partial [bacterium]
MKIDKNVKILDLLKESPYLIDVLVNISPEFRKLKNPLLRKTIGRLADLEHASKMSGVPFEELSGTIADAVEKETGSRPDVVTEPDSGSKIEELKSIIRELHEGKTPEEQKERFARLLSRVSPSEIAEMEQSLIADGMPEEEVKRLCDVHVQVFAESLEAQKKLEVTPGHPVHTFQLENREVSGLVDRARFILADLESPPDNETLKKWGEELNVLFESISKIEKHYLRKENQLFPALEDHGISGPSKVMWAIHDDIRGLMKSVRKDLESKDYDSAVVDGIVLTTAISDMIYKEENILFPMCLETFSDADWARVHEGSDEIGYTLVVPETGWVPAEGPLAKAPPERRGAGEAPIWLNTGGLTPKQLDLVLNSLPLDITFVDATDRVQYYSGRERIFPRSPGIIGRAVQNCHPPSSVHIVEQILDAFKSGEQDSADFWIQSDGKFIYIRYFAIRDEDGNYEGTLEVSQ